MPVARPGAAVLLVLAAITPGASLAQTPQAPHFPPPWVAESKNFLMAIFNLKADEVRKLLPKEIEPLANKDGLVPVTLEMYETARAASIPSYKTVFLVVDVKGHDNREGAPGHFAVWGRVTPEEALVPFKAHFGFPYRFSEMSVTAEAKAFTGVVGTADKAQLRIKLERQADQPFSGQGSVHMVGVKRGTGVVRSEVPYLTQGHVAKVTAFEVQPEGDPWLTLLKEAAPVWALVSTEQVFSYSRPQAAQ